MSKHIHAQQSSMPDRLANGCTYHDQPLPMTVQQTNKRYVFESSAVAAEQALVAVPTVRLGPSSGLKRSS